MHWMRRLITVSGTWIFGLLLLLLISDSRATCIVQAAGPVFCKPTTGTVTQSYSQSHTAVDISGGASGHKGNPVYAPYSGAVAYVGMAELIGSNPNQIKHAVAINHGLVNGKYVLSLFVHLGSSTQSYVTVKVGDQVQRGQLIGYQGDAGQATGVHVHWEIHEYSQPFLNSYTSWGKYCTRTDLWYEFGGNASGSCHNSNPAGSVDPQVYAGTLSGYITAGCPPIPPNVPNPIAPANGSTLGSRSVTLQWQDTGDPDNNPNNYRDFYAEVWRSDGSWNSTMNWQVTTSWSFSVPSPGTYYWHVQSGDGAQGSGWTSTWGFNVANQPPNIPSLIAPANGSTLGSRSVTLQWQDTGDPDNYPNNYRNYSGWISNADNSWSQLINWQTSTSATVVVPADGTYYWKMQSGDGSVGSGWTGSWSFTVSSIPNPPSDLIQSDAIQDILTISWKDNSPNEDGFIIYKWDWNGQSWEFLYYDLVGPNSTTFIDSNLACGSDYFYQVSAYNSSGESARTDWVKASTSACLAPAMPNGLKVSGTTDTSLTLSWQDTSNDEAGFNIYKWGWNGSAWDFYYLTTLSANTASYTDLSLSCETSYFYQVSSFNQYGESDRTSWVQGTTLGCAPTQPTGTPTGTPNTPPTSTPTSTPNLPPTSTPTATPPATGQKHIFIPFIRR